MKNVNTAAEVRKIAETFRAFCLHIEFPSVYLYMLDNLGLTGISNYIEDKSSPFWRDMAQSDICIEHGQHLDSEFMDHDIINIVRCFSKNHDVTKWDVDFKRKLYKSIELPTSFPAILD